VKAPSQLETLERKAGDYEFYRAKSDKLQQVLGDMAGLLPEGEAGAEESLMSKTGRLSDLLGKAAKMSELTADLEQSRRENEQLVKQVAVLVEELELFQSQNREQKLQLADNQEKIKKLDARVEGFRETIGRLLLGEFEYYEVKDGDTLHSIAADPLVYGDPSRAVWLRQVNEGRVKQFNHLVPGEVLVVPRFPWNGTYEF